jgi:hypothetical protein
MHAGCDPRVVLGLMSFPTSKPASAGLQAAANTACAHLPGGGVASCSKLVASAGRCDLQSQQGGAYEINKLMHQLQRSRRLLEATDHLNHLGATDNLGLMG